MKYNLFLDDIRMPNECKGYVYDLGIRPDVYVINEWEIVRDHKEFVKTIEEKGMPEIVSFDHDLAAIHYDPKRFKETFTYYEETGNDSAKWLVEKCLNDNLELPICYVHSMNPIGRENIKQTLKDYERIKNNTAKILDTKNYE